MRNKRLMLATGAIALASLVPAWVSASCNTNTSQTEATFVQIDSGQGNYNCSVLSGDGGIMNQVSSPDLVINYAPDNKSISFTAQRGTDVDVVVVGGSQGTRCLYHYADNPLQGINLFTSDREVKTVTVCADGKLAKEAPPPPPEPVSTVEDACSANLTYSSGNFPGDVYIGYTKDANGEGEQAAICSKTPGQQQCINECVARTSTTTNCTPGLNGELPLDCAQCEWSVPDSDLKYCWYWENRVNPESNTFIPSPKKKSLNAQIDVTTGSNCYTVTLNNFYGRVYSYWYCP